MRVRLPLGSHNDEAFKVMSEKQLGNREAEFQIAGYSWRWPMPTPALIASLWLRFRGIY